MTILFDLGHPAHFHLYKNTINLLKENGHHIIISAKPKEMLWVLLDRSGHEYIKLPEKGNRFSRHIRGLFKIRKTIRRNKIDLAVGVSVLAPQASLISSSKSIVFDDDDDEIVPLFVKYVYPFSDIVLTPDSIERKTSKKINYRGVHELAYLHPNQFKPDINVIKRIGLTKDEPYFILRFVAMKSHHDKGHLGISLNQKRALISYLKDKGKIFITSEKPIEIEFEQYRLPVPSEEIHSLLYYATLFLGDSQTMTSEAAILGTPALKCNTFAGKLSVPNELENKYALCYSYQPVDFEKFLDKAKELLEMPDLKTVWEEKRQKFLADKIDVTAFMIWFIENYPASAKIMKEKPAFQNRFK